MNITQFMQNNGLPISVKRQNYVFMQGDADEHVYAVTSGLLKAYYVSADGKETVKSFLRPGGVIASFSAAHKKEYCTFNLLALANTELLKMPFSDFYKAAEESNGIAMEMIGFLLGLSMKKEQREYEFLNLPAEERYQKFAEANPYLVEQITQNDIARYLGITPVALSRIKKRLES